MMTGMRPQVSPPQPMNGGPAGAAPGGPPGMARPAMLPPGVAAGGAAPAGNGGGFANGLMAAIPQQQQNPQLAQQSMLANALRQRQGGLTPISQGYSTQHPMGSMR